MVAATHNLLKLRSHPRPPEKANGASAAPPTRRGHNKPPTLEDFARQLRQRATVALQRAFHAGDQRSNTWLHGRPNPNTPLP